MYGWVWTLLFTPIVWASREAAHRGGSRSSGGSRLPLSNYCRDSKVSCRAIPSWERCASRLQHNTHTQTCCQCHGLFIFLAVISLCNVYNHRKINAFCKAFLLKLLSWYWKMLRNWSFEEICCLDVNYLVALFWKPSCSALNLDATFENTLVWFIVSELRSATVPPYKTWLPSWVPGSPSPWILSSAL